MQKNDYLIPQELLEQDSDDSLLEQDLKRVEDQYLAEVKEGKQNPVTQFSYAVLLSRSRNSQKRGMAKFILMGLLEKEKESREYLYYLAIVCYKLGEYTEARKYTLLLLQHEPNNRQGLGLQKLIEDKIKKDGVTGILLTGGVAAAIGVAGVLLFAISKSNK